MDVSCFSMCLLFQQMSLISMDVSCSVDVSCFSGCLLFQWISLVWWMFLVSVDVSHLVDISCFGRHLLFSGCLLFGGHLTFTENESSLFAPSLT